VISLSQTICLRMVGWRQSNTCFQRRTQTLPKHRCKSWVTVTDNLRRHTKPTNPMLKEKWCSILSCQSTMTRNKSDQPTKSIYNSEHSIKTTRRLRQRHNEIHTNMFKTHRRVFQRLQQARRFLSWSFVLLTHRTFSTKLSNRQIHTIPKKSLLTCLQQLMLS
jgi:hypothetical protein